MLIKNAKLLKPVLYLNDITSYTIIIVVPHYPEPLFSSHFPECHNLIIIVKTRIYKYIQHHENPILIFDYSNYSQSYSKFQIKNRLI